MIKPYKAAPLPFQGQKRYWWKELSKLARCLPQGATVLDCFGGSGLCAHILKYERPDLRVIWNDYDDFQRRLDLIPQTNKYLEELATILAPFQKCAHIEIGTPAHEAITELLDRASREGADLLTISRAINFSTCFELRTSKACKYYANRKGYKPYDATGYLEGVERVKMDWQELLASYPEDAILLLDPPYLSTDASRYGDKQDGIYFGLSDHLDIMAALRGRQYVLFTSNKSETLILEASIKKTFGVSYFGDGARIVQRETSLSGKGNGYTDILVTNLPEPPTLPL